jgi:hypothetical protein
MQGFVHQLLSGLANGGIYASVALALVMIYQATQLVNFAQGEMAMFSTYIAWAMLDAGFPYWAAFGLKLVFSFIAGVAIERIIIRPGGTRAGVDHRYRVHRPAAHSRVDLQLHDQELSEPVPVKRVVRQQRGTFHRVHAKFRGSDFEGGARCHFWQVPDRVDVSHAEGGHRRPRLHRSPASASGGRQAAKLDRTAG